MQPSNDSADQYINRSTLADDLWQEDNVAARKKPECREALLVGRNNRMQPSGGADQ